MIQTKPTTRDWVELVVMIVALVGFLSFIVSCKI
jgi:hypothetical protein